MYKIGIIGSGPERFSDLAKVRRAVGYTIDHLGFQYGDVVFNIRSNIGVGLWAGEECIDREYKYHLFLPYSLEKTAEHWYDDQRNMLVKQYGMAYSLTIAHPEQSNRVHDYDESYDILIDDSNFLVCFWSGVKQGEVFDTIKCALKHNKIVVNGLDDFKLMTNKDLIKSKTWKKE